MEGEMAPVRWLDLRKCYIAILGTNTAQKRKPSLFQDIRNPIINVQDERFIQFWLCRSRLCENVFGEKKVKPQERKRKTKRD